MTTNRDVPQTLPPEMPAQDSGSPGMAARRSGPPAGGTLTEPARAIPVRDAVDVAVAGGGIAGVAAAVAAARAGASVCLIEKAGALGGLATLGNVINWLPICDGCGRQVSAGLAEELLQRAAAGRRRPFAPARFGLLPACWQPGGDPEERKRIRYRVDFNPGAYLLELERFVTDAGVRILYDTRVCALGREANRMTHLIVENKSGRTALACGATVDATGDADLCFLGGETTESLDNNVRCGWFYHLCDGVPHLNVFSTGRDPREPGTCFRGDDGSQVTAQILGTRALIRERIASMRAEHPESDIEVFLPATLACFRMTRRLVGALSLEPRHLHHWFADTVGLVSDWRRPGPVYALPKRILQGLRNVNLLAAGRCVSAAGDAWDVLRSIPACAVSGQAAGLAAALAVEQYGGDASRLPAAELQCALRGQGVLLDPDRVRAALAPPPGPG